ncbi:MAG: peptidase, partial [Verrucomicrobia bacterium]|nr:peptidase [Verrucomicrobiota bacterium]
MHRRRVRFSGLVAFAFLLVAGCATDPATFLAPPPIPAAERPTHNLEVFDRSWSLVNEKFFDAKLLDASWAASHAKFRLEAEKAADEPALFGAINRMLGQLKESHLVALLPKNAFEFRTQRMAGVGIRMVQVEGKRVVTETVPGSPAEAAGIQPGWLVVSRDGVEIEKAGPSTAEPGRPIKFEFLDLQDAPRTMTLKAAVVTFER